MTIREQLEDMEERLRISRDGIDNGHSVVTVPTIRDTLVWRNPYEKDR
jgi:hypothetical protein